MDVWSRIAIWILCGFLLHHGQGERPPGTYLDDATIAGKEKVVGKEPVLPFLNPLGYKIMFLRAAGSGLFSSLGLCFEVEVVNCSSLLGGSEKKLVKYFGAPFSPTCVLVSAEILAIFGGLILVFFF